jgi:hypothetical protein
MADGLICKNCGWQETNHLYGPVGDDREPYVKQPGYKVSLTLCPGFYPNKKLLRALETQRAKEEDWTRMVYSNRERTATVILEAFGYFTSPRIL